jgi:hypothetical protein
VRRAGFVKLSRHPQIGKSVVLGDRASGLGSPQFLFDSYKRPLLVRSEDDRAAAQAA